MPLSHHRRWTNAVVSDVMHRAKVKWLVADALFMARHPPPPLATAPPRNKSNRGRPPQSHRHPAAASALSAYHLSPLILSPSSP